MTLDVALQIDRTNDALWDAEAEHDDLRSKLYDLEEQIDDLKTMLRQVAAGAHSDLALAVVEGRWDDAVEMSRKLATKQ